MSPFILVNGKPFSYSLNFFRYYVPRIPIQIRSLDPARFIDHRTGKANMAGTMPSKKMAAVEQALKAALDIP